MNLNNENEDLAGARLTEHLEAAAEQAKEVSSAAARNRLEDGVKAKSLVPIRQLVEGYLMDEWTCFRGNGEIVPEMCSHIDVGQPTVWYGLLNVPNHVYCQECAGIEIAIREEEDRYVCDRCHKPEVETFYDIGFPVANILIIGSVCERCADKAAQ